MVTRRPPNLLTLLTAISPVKAGSQVVTGNVPVGSTANLVVNGNVIGPATVSPTGLATYGPYTLKAADKSWFSWSLSGVTPVAQVAGTAPVVAPSADPIAAAKAAQAASRASELTAATNDNGRAASGSGTIRNLARPVISGKPKVGEKLIGYPGLWTAAAGLTYAWLVAGAVVSGATNRVYTVQAADSGKTVEFQVKASDGTTVVKSAPQTMFATLTTVEDDTGAVVTTDDGSVVEMGDRGIQVLAPYSPDMNRVDAFAAPTTTGITVTVADADLFVGPTSMPLSLYAPGFRIVNVYHSNTLQLQLVPDVDGYVQGIVPLTGVYNGALWLETRGLIDANTEELTTSAVVSGFDVVVRGGATAPLNAIPPAAQANGLTTIGFSEDFSSPLNVATVGTLPSGGKWYGNQAFDPKGYGDSTFAPPEGQYGTMTVFDNMLRVRAVYDPAAQASLKDGYGRTSGWVSGTICTSFPDATTTVPNMAEGYYECEVRVPKGVGTWPAFWLNDQTGLKMHVAGNDSRYGRETDGLEQYNFTPGHVCTLHRYQPNPNYNSALPESDSNRQMIDVSTEFHIANDLGQEVWAWVRVGVLTLTDRVEFYVNDNKVGVTDKFNPPDRSGPALEHIILGLAMGGGWPLGIPPSKHYNCYFRNVRQFYKKAA